MYDGKERKEEGKERKEQRVTSKSLKPHIPFSFLIHAPEAQFPLLTPSPTHNEYLEHTEQAHDCACMHERFKCLQIPYVVKKG